MQENRNDFNPQVKNKRRPPGSQARYAKILGIPLSVLIFFLMVVFSFAAIALYPYIFKDATRRNRTEEAITASAPAPGQTAAVTPSVQESKSPSEEQASVEPEETPEAGAEPAKPSEEESKRAQRIARLVEEVLKDLRKNEAVTPDTIYLKSGKELHCTVLNESESQFEIRYKGLTTTIQKDRIQNRESRTLETVEQELRKMALAQATRIVDEGLVRYGDEWITPGERAHRVQIARIRLEKDRIEAQKEAEIAIAEAKLQEQHDLQVRAENERLRIEAEEQLQRERALTERTWPPTGTLVPLKSSPAGGWLVPVTILGPKNSATVFMTLDTGATICCIKPYQAQLLGLQTKRYQDFRYADGRTSREPVVMLQELSVQDQSVQNLEASIGNCGGGNSQGLLGMNFLGNFEFEINPKQKVLILRPRR